MGKWGNRDGIGIWELPFHLVPKKRKEYTTTTATQGYGIAAADGQPPQTQNKAHLLNLLIQGGEMRARPHLCPLLFLWSGVTNKLLPGPYKDGDGMENGQTYLWKSNPFPLIFFCCSSFFCHFLLVFSVADVNIRQKDSGKMEGPFLEDLLNLK
jgi:hypothetical protein